MHTPERVHDDPAIVEEQAAALAAIRELEIPPHETYSSAAMDTYLTALDLTPPLQVFLPTNKVNEVTSDLDIWNSLQGTPANFLPQVDSTIILSNGGETPLNTRRAILYGNLQGAGRTRLSHTPQGVGFHAVDVGFHHLEQVEDGLRDTGGILEIGLIRALEKEISLAIVDNPRDESAILRDITAKDVAAQSIRTIICKDPSLLNTMLRARETFNPTAQEQLKEEFDRVMGEGFYDTMVQFPRDTRSIDQAKNFVMLRSAEHRADKRVRVDSFRLVLEQVVENNR